MLKQVGTIEESREMTTIKKASFPGLFKQGLEYSSPARGTWNIVHTGMLIPQSHQIFVCAYGCLRGVVLTAAEMNAMGRYSAISILPENVLNGDMEELMISGVRDILQKLPQRPKAILLFISCQHFFLAYDQSLVFRSLREEFPDIAFADCYMIPTLRKSGITPDQKMRIQMYSILKKMSQKTDRVNIMGSNLPLDSQCELRTILKDNGFLLKSIHDCSSFEDYLNLADACLNIIMEPLALKAGEDMKNRLGIDCIYLPQGDRASYRHLLDRLEAITGRTLFLDEELLSKEEEKADRQIEKTRELLADTELVLDASFTFHILGLAKLLVEKGFHVAAIHADAFLPEEKEAFLWLKEHAPQIELYPISRPCMRLRAENKKEKKILALGQKAAYFCDTPYFVNIAEGGGFFGYSGIKKIMKEMEEAIRLPKDPKSLIQKKGFGCQSCI